MGRLERNRERICKKAGIHPPLRDTIPSAFLGTGITSTVGDGEGRPPGSGPSLPSSPFHTLLQCRIGRKAGFCWCHHAMERARPPGQEAWGCFTPTWTCWPCRDLGGGIDPRASHGCGGKPGSDDNSVFLSMSFLNSNPFGQLLKWTEHQQTHAGSFFEFSKKFSSWIDAP